MIDPLGSQYEKINKPIKNYLFGCSNFMRCLIKILREDSDGYENMQTEKLKIPARLTQSNDIEEESSEEDEKNEWEELYTPNRKNTKRIKFKESDMVSILMNFYGSREAFIKEYQCMLTEKFLGI